MTVSELIEQLKTMPPDAPVRLFRDDWITHRLESLLADDIAIRFQDSRVKGHAHVSINGSLAVATVIPLSFSWTI